MPMTEEQWRQATDPGPMLDFLRTSDRASERKLRLFAVACCRRVARLFSAGPQVAEALELFAGGDHWVVGVRERYADGLASGVELAGAASQAGALYGHFLYGAAHPAE